MTLSAEELQRYARHLVLPQVGREGQERLRASSVLVVGLGGLGSPAALYLAAAGVGRLGLLDHDHVAVHNLQRQVLHDTPGIGRAKTESARDRLEALNPHVRTDTWTTTLTSANARGIIRDHDVVLDGTDSFAARYLVNDACVLEGKPDVHASIHRFEGQLSVFAAKDGPCYRCLHPEPPPAGSVPNCAEGGVLGVLPGLLGAMQAAEAIKLLLGIGEPLVGRLLVAETLGMRFREMAFERDPSCEWCGTRTRTELLEDYAAFCGEGRGMAGSEDDAHGTGGARPREDLDDARREVTPAELVPRLARGEPVFMLDVREPWEHEIAQIEGATLIPMAAVPSRVGDVPRDRTVVVLCHHGARSAMVADYLRASGHARVLNLAGGIDRWSVEVDPSVPRY
jgi:molybdopterin/thiamine biosynthesis adenylyltransferase/rhodanese-related sulfurtransferase